MPKPKPKPSLPADFAAALDRLPNLARLADHLGMPLSTVRAWRRRNSIPATYWDPVIEHARDCGILIISYDLFRAFESNRWILIKARRLDRSASATRL